MADPAPLREFAGPENRTDPWIARQQRREGQQRRAERIVAKAGPEGKAAATVARAADKHATGARGGRPMRDVSRETSRTGPARAGIGAVQRWSGKGSGARKLLVAEFLACVVILALAPLSTKHRGDDVHAWIRRWFGISGLFLFLALAATAGDRVGRIAAASGLVATAALVFNDADVILNLLAALSHGPAGAIPQPKPGQTLPIPGSPGSTITGTADGGWIIGSGGNW